MEGEMKVRNFENSSRTISKGSKRFRGVNERKIDENFKHEVN